MNLRDLTTLFRNEVDDTTAPFLWSDEEVTEFANDAEAEACRRARLLVDSSSADICALAVLAADAGLVTLDPRVMFVRRAHVEGARPLARMNMQDMESDNPYWQNATAGTPRMFITDYETGKLLLWPAPDQDEVLLLTVVRTPLEEMNDDDDTPEIAPRFHRSLRFWMMFRAYSKQDSQANDPKKAADSLALFEQEFGKKSSALDETWIEREQSYLDGTF
jgi:hypothetical protein